jgi:hypothetical protein
MKKLKYVKNFESFKIFEFNFLDQKTLDDDLDNSFQGDISDVLKDMILEFQDDNCDLRIIDNDNNKIRLCVELDRKSIFGNEWYKNNRLPEWFIDNCERITDFMVDNGYKVRYKIIEGNKMIGVSNLEDVSNYNGSISKIELTFIKND